MGERVPTSANRSKEYLTASAFMAEPSWKVTPDFSVMVTDRPSPAISQLSASRGTTVLSTSRVTSVSNRYGSTRLRPDDAGPCGSRLAGSDVIARVSTASAGAASAAVAAVSAGADAGTAHALSVSSVTASAALVNIMIICLRLIMSFLLQSSLCECARCERAQRLRSPRTCCPATDSPFLAPGVRSPECLRRGTRCR